MRLVIFFMGVVLLGSCKSLQPSRKTIESVKDSTVTTVRFVEKDTLITVPGDTLTFSVPFYELSETPIERTNGRTTARISRGNGQVTVECLTEKYEQLISYQNEIIETLRQINRNKEETIEVPVKFVPWYIKTLAWIGGLFLLLVFVQLLIKKFKPV